MPQLSPFAEHIARGKMYLHDDESWGDASLRVTKHVMAAVGLDMRHNLCKRIHKALSERKFLPGGRYWYAAGRPFHQVNNCLMLRVHDSREGWSELLQKTSMALMTGAGIGVDYSCVRGEGRCIRKTGGTATGPIALMQMINECGRGIMQGGSRRSAIWAGLHWMHPDAQKLITSKNWSPEVMALKAKDFNFPATLDQTNISILLDDEFFDAFSSSDHQHHSLAHGVYWTAIHQMLSTGEPGFCVNVGRDRNETLRNAPVSEDTHILTPAGYRTVRSTLGGNVTVWTGKRWVNTAFKKTKTLAKTVEVLFTGKRSITCDPDHEFFVRDYQGAGRRKKLSTRKVRAADLTPGDKLHVSLPTEKAYRTSELLVEKVITGRTQDVFCCDVKVPEHSFCAEGVIISNCTELTSKTTDDICNLGSINLSRIETLEEFKDIIELAIPFLLAGSVYSDVPYTDVQKARDQNRRLGLGLMGLHEWLLQRGKWYGPDDELETWLREYAKSTPLAHYFADEWSLSRPKKTRSIAPNGTIGIVGETTGGIEPIPCVAYKRRYLVGREWRFQYVINPTAERLIKAGVKPAEIEDAYVLAGDAERRVAFQAWVQQFVDHAISSTINLPSYGSRLNNSDTERAFGEMLVKYLPRLRGITCYPEGGRSGQPITPVPYEEAAGAINVEYIESDSCDLTKGGSCGD